MGASVLFYPAGVTRRGRMIRSLYQRGSWSAKEIVEEGFAKTEKEVHELVSKSAPQNKSGWGHIDYLALVGAVIDFMAKHRRWPINDEWRNSNGLPALSTVRNCYYQNNWHLGRERREEVERGGTGMSELQRDVARDKRLKPYMAFLLPNATHRRDAMARFPDAQLVKHMTLIDDDPQVGKLYSMTGQTMLRVVNSTPEPDGSHAIYVLPTPPNMQKARQSLAWTFGVTEGWENFVIQEES